MLTCSSCNASNPTNSAFCGQCGSPLSKEIDNRCVNVDCRFILPPGSSFCGQCGTKQPRQSSPPPPSQPSPPSPSQPPPPETASRLIERDRLESMQRPDLLRPLYVTHESLANDLSAIIGSLPLQRRGTILAVKDSKIGAERTRQYLRKARRKPSAICIIGSQQEIAHDLLDNPLKEDSINVILTDNFFGTTRQDLPSLSQRLKGDLLGDIPVSRIPTTDMTLIASLLQVEDDLSNGWDDSLAIYMEGPYKLFQQNAEQVIDWCANNSSLQCLISPPVQPEESAQSMADAKRLYCLLHGNRNVTEWNGDHTVGFFRQYPPAITLSLIKLPHRATVLSQSCFGAWIQGQRPAMSLKFLQEGQGVFIGSTITAWAASDHISTSNTDSTTRNWGLSGLASEQIAALCFSNLDLGFDAAESLWHAKKTITDAAKQDKDLRHVPLQTHNTVLSFLVYGAPWARVTGAIPRRSPSSLAAPPKKEIQVSKDSILDKYRQRRTMSLSERMGRPPRSKLSQEVLNILDTGRIEFTNLVESHRHYSSYQEIKDHLENILEVAVQEANLQTYQVNGRQYGVVIGAGDKENSAQQCLMHVSPKGEILGYFLSTGGLR